MKNTNISQYGCSTVGEQIEKNRKQLSRNAMWNTLIALAICAGIILIISFLTIPR